MLSQQQLTKLNSYRTQCARRGWRALIHIVGKEDEVLAQSSAIISLLDLNNILYANQSVQVLQSRLGSECDALVINAYQGINPNVLGMVCACLRAGGVLLLLTPEEKKWPQLRDPDYLRMLSDAAEIESIKGYFIQRLAQSLWQQSWIMRVEGLNVVDVNIAPSAKGWMLDSSEQQAAIEAIIKVALGHARRPLVLSADRGRGKSAAIGIACGQLMRQKKLSIAITSVSPQAVSQLFKHLAETLGQPSGALAYYLDASCIHYLPIDELLQSDTVYHLVVIDEAAALPVSMLQKCAERFNRLVFSTTVNGYEGSGRGFELRFLPFLQQRFSQLKKCSLSVPLRWAKDDPLEAWLGKVLLLTHKEGVSLAEPVAPCCYELPVARLAEDEVLLVRVFALLVLAHYQTSPDDLRLLLDHPDVRVFVVEDQKEIIGAALLMQEGNFPPDMLDSLGRGRRCRGHILPQALIGDGFTFNGQRFWRVMRIVIHPSLQQKQLGKLLLSYIEKTIDGDFIGASFSLEAKVLRFWQSAGYALCRIGSHKESTSGQYAGIVLKALQAQSQIVLADVRAQFAARLGYQLLTQYTELDVDTLMQVPQELAYHVSAFDVEQVKHYANAYRSYEQASASLASWLLAELSKGNKSDGNVGVLAEKVLLNRHWQIISDRYKLSGRAQIEEFMRQRIKERL